MGIVTRTGDKGETSLADGQRIKKHDPLIDAYGIVDELNSWIGLIRASAEKQFDPLDERLARIQRDCFVLGAHLATPSHPKNTRNLPDLPQQSFSELEKEIDETESNLAPLKNFILPGGHPVAAELHVARTVARRAERAVSAILESSKNDRYAFCLIYLNRLSDWFFIMARSVNARAKKADILWKPAD